MSESPVSRIFISVVTTLVTAFVLWLSGYLPSLLNWIYLILSATWSWCWNKQILELPGCAYIFIVLMIIFGVTSLAKIIWEQTPFYHESYLRYTSDHFWGAKWIWKYSLGQPVNIWCECPKCSTTLVYNISLNSFNHEQINLFCETCGYSPESHEGSKSCLIGKITRQIDRKIKTKDFINALLAQGLGGKNIKDKQIDTKTG